MSSPFQQKFSGKSPLKQGAYESAADNPVYVSTQPAMNAMQDAIAKVGVAAIKASNTPEKKAKRQNKRADRREKRQGKKFPGQTKETEAETSFIEKTAEIRTKADDNTLLAENNKKNKKSKAFFCKGKAAGSHLDSYGKTVTCP